MSGKKDDLKWLNKKYKMTQMRNMNLIYKFHKKRQIGYEWLWKISVTEIIIESRIKMHWDYLYRHFMERQILFLLLFLIVVVVVL